VKEEQLHELMLQSLEHEKGGVKVYEAALKCAVNEDLRQEWEEYLDQTRSHVKTLTEVCAAMGIEADKETPGRGIVRDLGTALIAAMEMARADGDPSAAQLVAAECVVLAETKDHLDWELLSKCTAHLDGKEADVLKQACEDVEDEEDEHLYHTKGWCRELWIESLGMKAVLPPPEEKQHVKTAIGAARAEQSVAGKR